MKKIAVYPGSFDPVTNGHLDVIVRAGHLFDVVIVAVTDNLLKAPTFDLKERLFLLKTVTKEFPYVQVAGFSGLLIDYLKKVNSRVIVRGLRAISDFEYEFQMALMNRSLSPEIETIFLMPDESYTYLSSSLIKEIARLGGAVEKFAPKIVAESLKGKFGLTNKTNSVI
ncbi:MAG: pantetheine-phosphate adenylyltransferase [Elusimicrobiota bacterium]